MWLVLDKEGSESWCWLMMWLVLDKEGSESWCRLMWLVLDKEGSLNGYCCCSVRHTVAFSVVVLLSHKICLYWQLAQLLLRQLALQQDE